MTQLTIPQVHQLALEAGFTGDAAIMITAIADRESGCNTDPPGPNDRDNPYPGCRSWGLVQINTCPQYNNAGIPWREHPETLLDPRVNLRAAYEMSKGGTDFGPWTTYRSGIAPANTAKVKLALAAAGPVPPVPSSPTSSTPTTTATPVVDIPDWVPGAGAVNGASDLIGVLSDSGTWRRVTYVLVGFLLAGLGLVIIRRDTVGDLARTAATRGTVPDTDTEPEPLP